jgi:hypothetical protein
VTVSGDAEWPQVADAVIEAQELIVSRSVATPFVVVGGLATIGAYTGALYLLRKS